MRREPSGRPGEGFLPFPRLLILEQPRGFVAHLGLGRRATKEQQREGNCPRTPQTGRHCPAIPVSAPGAAVRNAVVFRWFH